MVKPRHHVTDAELAVLQVLWRNGRSRIREIADELYPDGTNAHYATVQKLLDRLESKSCVERQLEGRANVFSVCVAREELIGRRLRDTADKLCDGSLAPLLTHLVQADRLSAEELQTLRKLVEDLDRPSSLEEPLSQQPSKPAGQPDLEGVAGDSAPDTERR